MHVAGLICQRLSENQRITINKQEERMIRLTALLHDIGQGPFSHVSEFLIDRYRDKAALGETEDKGKIHERLTVDIIQKDPEIAKILNEDETKYIADIIRGSRRRNFKRDIVSSSLDADKMDYLLRDSYFCGVKYGQYDLEKIVDSLRVWEKGPESYLGIDHECIYALEQLFLAKYHMTQQVYAHRVRCITDAMIVRGLILAIERRNTELHDLYCYDGSEQFVENYTKYHDENIVDLVCTQTNSSTAKEIFERLRHRRLFKQVCCFQLGEVENAIDRGKLLNLDVGDEVQQTLENAAARELKLDPSKVIVYRRKVKNPTYIPEVYRLDPEETYVLDKNGVPKQLTEFQDLVFSFDKKKETQDEIDVYAPMDNWAKLNGRKRKLLQERLKSTILSSIP
jgi:hypothetical protein